MTRNVRAILITGDKPESPGIPTPGAPEAVNVVVEDLVTRFSDADVVINRLRVSPTNQLVTQAFAEIMATVHDDELFVVVFAGHGKESDDWQLAQAWCLTKDELFTDIELAKTLLKLPDRVDVVVISACCYGEGFFTSGPEIGPHGTNASEPSALTPLPEPMQLLKLQAQSMILGRVLVTGWDNMRRNSPMVCISGAGKSEEISLVHLADLARETVQAAAAGQSYAQLDSAFAAEAVVGRKFHVDARPNDRIDDRVLST